MMLAAKAPTPRPADAKLLVIDQQGQIRHVARSHFADLLHPHDLVIANDAATLPASLHGTHVRSRGAIEVRLAGRRTLDVNDITHFDAIVFGAGDFHTLTEQRPQPPALRAGDTLQLGPLTATVEKRLDHPRLVSLQFHGTTDAIWAGLAHHGRPIQYTHMEQPLALWDVWTSHAAMPVAFEPPSAGLFLNWKVLGEIRARGARFATITHAAGISSTGDAVLDQHLPFDEPYYIPPTTAAAIRQARKNGGRVIAIGTTVVRALEHAAVALRGTVKPGYGLATQRLGADSRLRLVDAIFSGTHEPGTSHYALLHAFTDDATLRQAHKELEGYGYKTHEFGDSVLIEALPGRRAVPVREIPHDDRDQKGVDDQRIPACRAMFCTGGYCA